MKYVRILFGAVGGFILDIIGGIVWFLLDTLHMVGILIWAAIKLVFWASLTIGLVILFNFAIRYFAFLDPARKWAGIIGVVLIFIGLIFNWLGEFDHSRDRDKRRQEEPNFIETLGGRLAIIGLVLVTLLTPSPPGMWRSERSIVPCPAAYPSWRVCYSRN